MLETLKNSAATSKAPAPMGLFPTMDSLESVYDLAMSQLPVMTPNQMVSLLGTYHNTLLHVQSQHKKD